MRIVAALGGNALLLRGEAPESGAQESHVRDAARALAPLAGEHELVVAHGNGPQVGVLALESAADPALTRPYPLDALVAETQGLIGNWLTGAIERSSTVRAVCVLTRTVVDQGDLGFEEPTKFVGPIYTREQAAHLANALGWQVRRDGSSWRRVVASPEPIRILEVPEIELLLCNGNVVVCAGGGGVPVVRDATGSWRDVEAVVDKDLAAAVLARQLRTDALLLLTDVSNVELGWGTSNACPIETSTVDDLRGLRLPPGSMGPKVEAACRFVESGGRIAAIGRLEDAEALLAGTAGTTVVASHTDTPMPAGRPAKAGAVSP